MQFNNTVTNSGSLILSVNKLLAMSFDRFVLKLPSLGFYWLLQNYYLNLFFRTTIEKSCNTLHSTDNDIVKITTIVC